MNKLWLAVLVILLAFFSCKTSENVTTAGKAKRLPPEDLLAYAKTNIIDFEWFSGKAKMKFNDGKINKGFTANIRMRKDSIIWISITSLMGIEGARVLIDKDTVRIIDRLNKKYVEEPIANLQQYVPFDLNLKLAQDLLVGNFLWHTDGKLKSKVDKNRHVLLIQDKTFDNAFWLDPLNYSILAMTLEEQTSKRNVQVVATDYEEIEGRMFAKERAIDFIDGDVGIYVEMDYSRIRWNNPMSFPFHVSDKYDEE